MRTSLFPLRAAAVSLVLTLGFTHSSRAAEPDASTNRWEREIEAFEAADKTNPPPQHAIEFLGSSTIRIWPDLQQDFPGHTVFKRGFGGSELSDSVAFADRIVIPYHPKMIVLYAGDNDLADGKTPARVFSDFKDFVRKIHAALPETRIAFLAVKPCPARERFLPEVRETNRLVKEYTEKNDKLTFINVYPATITDDGSLHPELLQKDGLHLNQEGYKRWVAIIRPVLDQYDPK